MYKIGIIGTGIICKNHVNAIEQMENVRLQAVADIVIEKALNYAKPRGIKAYTDYKQMVLEENLDIVIINLPHKLHCEAAIFCAEQGINVLVEKPMATSVRECETMLKVSKENLVKLMVGHVQRYQPQNIKAKEIVMSGELGKLVFVEDNWYGNYFSESRPKWFFSKEMAGGGPLMNMGVHMIDRTQWLADSKIKRISGNVGYYKEGFEIEGNFQFFAELENGIDVSAKYWGYVDLPETVNQVTLFFTEGIMKVRRTYISVFKQNKAQFEIEVQKEDDPFLLQLADFINAIDNNSIPAISGEYGLEVVRIAQSIY